MFLLKTFLENTLTLFKKKKWVAYSPNKKMLQFAWHVTCAVPYIGMVKTKENESEEKRFYNRANLLLYYAWDMLLKHVSGYGSEGMSKLE